MEFPLYKKMLHKSNPKRNVWSVGSTVCSLPKGTQNRRRGIVF